MVSQLSVPFLNVSWSPVIVYDELMDLVSYNISFNGTHYNTTSNAWTKFNAADVPHQCDDIKLSITPFVAASNQTLVGNASQWNISEYCIYLYYLIFSPLFTCSSL